MKKNILLILLIFSVLQTLFSQFVTRSDQPIFGFDHKLKGNDFSYYYPIPSISNSLLVRGNKDMNQMEFVTKPIPKEYSSKTVLFVFPFAIGSNAIPISIDMYVKGEKWFTFDTRSNPNWSIVGKNGAQLAFENIAYDANQDMKGFLYLRIPKELITPGESLQIKFIAQDAESQTWIILYTDELKNEIKARLLPAIVEEKGVEKQTIFIELFHFAPPQKAIVKVDGKTIAKQDLKLGYNQFSLTIDKVTEPKSIVVDVEYGSTKLSQKITLTPSRNWTVHFVQHSHTDIGYTRSQSEILAEHIRYIDYALDFCDLTDRYPKEAQFRWTCEAAWAVEEFLLTRPKSQTDRLIKRIKEGRIEVTSMMFNFDEIPDENILAQSLKPLKTMKQFQIPVQVAMQNDVNGIGWCFADYFPDLGVKYLNMGINAARALTCFNYPTVFRWQSPSGSEMIAYRAEHYNKGNFVGVEKADFQSFEIKLLEYLSELEQTGYPYSVAQLQFSGYLIDNSPPSIQACENIKKWNEKYKFPKIKLALASEFFNYFETNHFNELPIIKGGWPDWWTDGFGASPREVIATRYAQSDLIANSATLALTSLNQNPLPQNTTPRIEEILKAILFYGEHTTGFHASISEPYCKQTLEQRAIKESYAWEAYRKAKIMGETAQGILQTQFSKSPLYPSIIVTNTLPWMRSGMVKVYMEHEMVPIQNKMEIFDSKGIVSKYQIAENRPEGTYWWIWFDSIPPFTSKQFFIRTTSELATIESINKNTPPEQILKIENQWYSIDLNCNNGTIINWFDKTIAQNLLDTKSLYQLGEFVGESLTERGSLESKRMGDHNRYCLESIHYIGMIPGAIFDSYKFSAKAKNGIVSMPSNFFFELRVYKTFKQIELYYTIFKNENVNPESFYIAMPFNIPNGKIYCELPGGVMEAGVDQIKGSSSDWNTSQSFVSVASDQTQIVVSCNEFPLWHFGNINMGRYNADAKPESTHLFSWPMNNYWGTNFNADFRGEMNWSYYLTTSNQKSHQKSTQFGWNQKIPFTYRVLPKDIATSNQKSNLIQYLDFHSDQILLVALYPQSDQKSLILHIREIAGTSHKLHITSPIINIKTIEEVNAIGEVISTQPITIKPMETKFLKITF